MIEKDLLAKVRKLEIQAKRLVTEALAGEYVSAFKGQGMEFAEVREYVPGDDIRGIDWNVTARMGHPFVKRFVEERELTIFFAVDLSGSMSFGSGAERKREVAADLAAGLALVATRNNDKVGLSTFTGKVEEFVPPRKGRAHMLRVIREILGAAPQGRGTNIASALDHAARTLKRHSVLFLISDFQDQGYESTLAAVARRHDLICVTIDDRLESELPPVGLISVRGPEGDGEMVLDAGSRAFREAYAKLARERSERLAKAFRRAGADRIALRTEVSFVDPLISFFRNRDRRRARFGA